MLNALEKGDKLALSQAIRSYKSPNGNVNYEMILSIPASERLPQLLNSQGYAKVHGWLVAGIQLAMEGLNLSQTLNASQIFDLCDTLIDSANEDQLAFQDVILFLQKLVRGEMGALYSQMDIAKFMELFEVYREDRYVALKTIREEQHIQNKSYGSPDRWSEMNKDEERNAFHEAMKTYIKDNNADTV